MKELENLKAEINRLESQAQTVMNRPHNGNAFESSQENIQRGKFIAYGHAISLIDNILNKKKP
jgi:hypothetical protein